VKLETLPQCVRLAVEAAKEKKAAGITVLDLSGASAFTEFFVICTGFSTPQVQAICTEVEEQLYKNLGRSPEHREGQRSAEWALLDFGGFVVHVMISSGSGVRRPSWKSPTTPKFDPLIESCRIQLSARSHSTMRRFPAGRSAAVRNDDHGTITVDRPGPRSAPPL
jgi:ribosome-associated protein